MHWFVYLVPSSRYRSKSADTLAGTSGWPWTGTQLGECFPGRIAAAGLLLPAINGAHIVVLHTILCFTFDLLS